MNVEVLKTENKCVSRPWDIWVDGKLYIMGYKTRKAAQEMKEYMVSSLLSGFETEESLKQYQPGTQTCSVED